MVVVDLVDMQVVGRWAIVPIFSGHSDILILWYSLDILILWYSLDVLIFSGYFDILVFSRYSNPYYPGLNLCRGFSLVGKI